jgi:hypothetical protein
LSFKTNGWTDYKDLSNYYTEDFPLSLPVDTATNEEIII